MNEKGKYRNDKMELIEEQLLISTILDRGYIYLYKTLNPITGDIFSYN